MRTATIRAWCAVHSWSSLICTAFLLMLCVTGLPLIFHAEIDGALHPPPPLAAMPAGTPSLSLDALLARAVARRPGETPLYLSFDGDRPVVNVTTALAPDAPAAAMHFQSLDRRTGAAVPQPAAGGVMDILLRLHTDMFAGLAGELFLGAMGLLFAIAVLSGVVLYVPYTARMPFGTLRRTRRARVRWTDYHNLLGVSAALWTLVVGVTGVANTLVTPVTAAWKADQLAAMGGGAAAVRAGAHRASVQKAVDDALAAVPGMRPQFVAFPGVAYSSGRHYAVFLQGSTPLTEKLLAPVFVDAISGRMAPIRPMPWYMAALLLAQPLHFGDYGGLAMKLLWAALDLVAIGVLASGLVLWATRRRARRPEATRMQPA